ncbi:alpha/beta fold hydrolase [Klebsiella variicola]|nr:alpha/beta fold hydrolase [Klebsiella variicola]HCB0000765.1 alpha/beta fold hydrolase [Klebsiella variicola subsp. variicola]
MNPGFWCCSRKSQPGSRSVYGRCFCLFKEGQTRNAIQDVIRSDLIQAYNAKKEGKGPLVVVGHSMGGVILADMLTDPTSAGLPDDIAIDALFTVGSQPGLFAALGVLSSNPPTGSSRRRPDCVKKWFNVFDPIDPLAFRTDMIYTGAEDVVFNSVAGITDAHSKYFQRPQFYARTRERLNASGIL